MTDQSFAITVKRFSGPGERGERHWYFLGAATTLYVSWQLAVVVGVLAGARVPASWSLDLAVVLTFIALLVPVVRTRADLAAIVAPGLLMPEGVLDLTLSNPRWIAGLVALVVAARTRHPLAAIAVGMPVLWLAQWAIR